MPVLSIGTGGAAKWKHDEADLILKGWLSLGGKGIDTAWIYGTEDQLPKTFAEVGANRSELFILTKVPGCIFPETFVDRDLKALGTDYIDLLLLHGPIGLDCQGAWKTLEDLHRKGVLRSIGVSNFGRASLENIMKVATVPPAVNQFELNVMKHDKDTLEYCRANGITPMAYSPLGIGTAENPTVQKVAANHNKTTYQIALKWIIQQGMVLTFQSDKTSHMKGNVDIFDFDLSEDELSELNSIAPDTVVV